MVGALALDVRDLSSSCQSSVAAFARHVAFLFLRFFPKWQVIHSPPLTGMSRELNTLDEMLRYGSAEGHVGSDMVGVW